MLDERCRLAYATVGDAQQPALLMLHGFMSCNAQWLANIPALSQHYYLVMVELWGHGDSPTPTDADQYSVAAYSEQFEALRAELDIPQWHLLGQSYGAGIMIRYALTCPQACGKVVVTNSRSAFGRLTPERARADGQTAAAERPFDPRALPFHPIHARRFPQHIKDALVASADNICAEAIRLGGRLGEDLYCADVLGQLAQPLLITNGRYEKAFQQDMARLQEKYPALNVANLDGGHSVNIEAADDFDRAVLDFLSDET
ncbi:MAG: alpha/beta fold hydrolase [Pseudomonadales bacterium]